MLRKKARWQQHKNATCHFAQFQKITSHNTATEQIRRQDIRDIVGEVRILFTQPLRSGRSILSGV